MMGGNAALSQFDAQFIQLAATRRIALPGRDERPHRSLPDHHIVDKARRHPQMPCCLAMTIALLDKRNDTRTQFYRMWLAHGSSPSTTNRIINQQTWESPIRSGGTRFNCAIG
jgi:hypothetical protein